MRRGRRAASLSLIGLLSLFAVGAVGCGDDDSDAPEPTVPSISVPESTVAPEPETTTTEPAETDQTTTDSGTGGVAKPVDPAKEDSPTNDKPPPPGSPEEAFEKACEQNPAACG